MKQKLENAYSDLYASVQELGLKVSDFGTRDEELKIAQDSLQYNEYKVDKLRNEEFNMTGSNKIADRAQHEVLTQVTNGLEESIKSLNENINNKSNQIKTQIK